MEYSKSSSNLYFRKKSLPRKSNKLQNKMKQNMTPFWNTPKVVVIFILETIVYTENQTNYKIKSYKLSNMNMMRSFFVPLNKLNLT